MRNFPPAKRKWKRKKKYWIPTKKRIILDANLIKRCLLSAFGFHFLLLFVISHAEFVDFDISERNHKKNNSTPEIYSPIIAFFSFIFICFFLRWYCRQSSSRPSAHFVSCQHESIQSQHFLPWWIRKLCVSADSSKFHRKRINLMRKEVKIYLCVVS